MPVLGPVGSTPAAHLTMPAKRGPSFGRSMSASSSTSRLTQPRGVSPGEILPPIPFHNPAFGGLLLRSISTESSHRTKQMVYGILPSTPQPFATRS